jgi:transposase-like protein
MELAFDKYKAQQFCDNAECQYYGKIGEDNIRTHSLQHHQVYCNSCKNIWVITKGTFFYNLKASVALVLEVLRLLSAGMGLRAVCRTKGVTPDAVGSWLLKAGDHVHEVTVYLERDMHLTQCQIDEFWSYILKKSPAQRRRNRTRRLGRSMDVCQRAASQWVDSYGSSWETDQGRGRAICPDDQTAQ